MTEFFEPAERGVQHAILRAANRRAVLTAITFGSGVSNADVARRTGLAPQTASAIVAELEADGLVVRGEVLRGRRGQPATPLLLNYDGAYAIGCELSCDHVEVLMIDLGSRRIAHYRQDFDKADPDAILNDLVAAVSNMIGKLDARQARRITGIGMAFSVDFGLGGSFIGEPDQRTLWQLKLRATLERETGLTTYAYNDGSAACWAQLLMAGRERPANFAYLFVGNRLGSGIAAEHRLWEGPTGNSANLGAMLVCKPDGGREFGHRMASLSALKQQLTAAGLPVPRSTGSDWDWPALEPVVTSWLREAGTALAQIVLNTAAVIEVDCVVIDGALPPAIVDRLVAATQLALDELPALTNPRPRLIAGRLGAIAPVLGAAQLSVYRRYFSRELEDMDAEA